MAAQSLPRRSEIHFVADVHLQDAAEDTWRDFFAYLAAAPRRCSAVYLLGDIFDAWIGDDDDRKLAHEAERLLRKVTASGVHVGLVFGNRDFMLGRSFARRTGVALLGARHVLDIGGRRLLAMHGDELCTHDAAYQRRRRLMLQPWALGLARLLPRRARLACARRMLASAQASAAPPGQARIDEQLAQRLLEQAGAEALVCGHLHAAAARCELAGGRSYYLLPHWPAAGGPGGALIADASGRLSFAGLTELLAAG